jgi:G protein beta subunit-like protein
MEPSRFLTSGIKLFQIYIRAPGIQRDYELKSPVNDVIIHPNQGELVSCDQAGSIRVWDLAENQCTHELLPEEDIPVRCVTMAADGSLLVASNNKVFPINSRETIMFGRQIL